jgi:hypothetical protein
VANVEEFVLKLNQQISPAASVASSALSQLEARIKAEQSALSGLESKLTSAKAKLSQLQEGFGGKVDIGAVAKQREAIAKLEGVKVDKKAGIGGLQDALPKFKQLAAEGDKSAASLSGLAKAAAESDGPLGKIAGGIEKIKTAGAAGIAVAVVVALIAITVAAIAGAVALSKYALAAGDAARSSRLLSGAAAGGVMAGAELEAVISDIALKSPLARDKIAEMGRSMELARLQGRNMQNALEAATTAASAIGDSAGAALTSIAEKSQMARRFMLTRNDFTGISAELEGTGIAFADVAQSIATAQGVSLARATQLIRAGQVSVKDGLEAMNDAVQKKFGKTVAAQMLSIGTQFSKMKEAFGKLFDGIDFEPLLRGLKTITSMFGQNTVTGMALKSLFNSIFSPLSAASEKVFPVIEAFIQGMIIATMMAYLGFLKVRKAITDAFGGESASKIDWIKTAMYAGGIAVVAVGGAIAGLVVAVALLAAVFIPLVVTLSLPFIFAAAVVYGLVRVIMLAYSAISSLVGSIADTFKAITGIDLGAVGGNIVDSLVNGIKAKIADVGNVMKLMGQTILGTLPSVLVMHSPSVLLTNQAKMAGESIVGPLKDAEPEARDAMVALGGGRPDFSGGINAARSGGKGGGAGGDRIYNVNVEYHGSRDDLPAFGKLLRDTLEQVSRQSQETA